MGSGDDARHLTVIDRRNLFLFEQGQKLILLAWVGVCHAGANRCGGERNRGANQSACKACDAGAHGSQFSSKGSGMVTSLIDNLAGHQRIESI